MKKSLFLFATAALTLVGCSKDNAPTPVNEEELITTVILEFTDSNGNTARFSYQDLDGTGPDTAVVTNDTLLANTTYTATVRFLNESENPAEEITDEVREEGAEHQVFFGITPVLNLSYVYDDADENQKPIGLRNIFTAGNASAGQLTLTLRHQPDKNAAGVDTGDITNAGGDTDVAVNFAVTIQ
jgi:hypothetical protein